MPRLLVVGSGPVSLYYGFLFSRYSYLVDHTITTERRKNDIRSMVSIGIELTDFKCIYKPSLVPTFQPWKYEYIIVACESKRAEYICNSLQQSDPPTIVLTSCWNTYHGISDNAIPILWGFPRILCESTKSCLKVVSSRDILIDSLGMNKKPEIIKNFETLFASIEVELQPVNLEYVYPYLFMLTTCMYTQLLNEQKVSLDNSIVNSDRRVMNDCYIDAYILLSETMKIPVNQAELQTGIRWIPDLLINTAGLLMRESRSSLSPTGWIINQLINHKPAKMQYFIKTLLADSNTKQFKRLRFAMEKGSLGKLG